MEVTEQAHVAVGDPSAVGKARRVAADLARRAGLAEADRGRVAIVVTEAATNLVKHAGRGDLFLRRLEYRGTGGVAMLALDRGPGIANVGAALRDGFSSAGTAGHGLGAIARLSTAWDVYSTPGGGAAVFARIAPPAAAEERGLAVGGLAVPCPGEDVSGDAWSASERDGRTAVLVADGLGHGAPAAEAARAAVGLFGAHADESPAALVARIHAGLQATRGAAVAVAEVDPRRRLVRFAGIGNIGAAILADGATRRLVSQHGTAGHGRPSIREFTYPWPDDAVFVAHSDGLVSDWTLARYPGLLRKPPMLLAGILYRDFKRGRDDVSVVVARATARAAA